MITINMRLRAGEIKIGQSYMHQINGTIVEITGEGQSTRGKEYFLRDVKTDKEYACAEWQISLGRVGLIAIGQ